MNDTYKQITHEDEKPNLDHFRKGKHEKNFLDWITLILDGNKRTTEKLINATFNEEEPFNEINKLSIVLHNL